MFWAMTGIYFTHNSVNKYKKMRQESLSPLYIFHGTLWMDVLNVF